MWSQWWLVYTGFTVPVCIQCTFIMFCFLIELRKQAFEEKRREFEDVRKKRKPPAEPRKRKKKEKSVDQAFPEMFVDGQMMVQQPQLQPPPKKRQRRPKQKKVDIEEDKDARVENFLQQLRMLANVPLQEPKVTSAIVNSPVHGSASILTGMLTNNFRVQF